MTDTDFIGRLRALTQQAHEATTTDELMHLVTHAVPTVLSFDLADPPFDREFQEAYVKRASPLQLYVNDFLAAAMANPSFSIAWLTGNLNALSQWSPLLAPNPEVMFRWAVQDPLIQQLCVQIYVENREGAPLRQLLSYRDVKKGVEREGRIKCTAKVLVALVGAIERHLIPRYRESFLPGVDLTIRPCPRDDKGELIAKECMGPWRVHVRQQIDALQGSSRLIRRLKKCLGYPLWTDALLGVLTHDIRYDRTGQQRTVQACMGEVCAWLPSYLAFVEDFAQGMGVPMPQHLLAEVLPGRQPL